MQNDTVNTTRDLGYDFIRFIAMLFILLHHLNTTWYEFHYNIPSIVNMTIGRGNLNMGGVGVALFFMISGALLIARYKTVLNIKNFYMKRLIRIEIPQMICFFCAFWCQYLIDPNIVNSKIGGIVISFLGLNYSGDIWIQYFNIYPLWVVGEWFTAVIIILYVLFPLLRWVYCKYCLTGGIIITLIFLINLKYEVLTRGNGWFSITNGLMCFWVGMLFEKYKQKICTKSITTILILAAILYWSINPAQIFGYMYLSCFIFSILLLAILYQIKYSNKFTKFICKYNYEIYLVHHRVFILFLPALLTSASNAAQLVISSILVIAITFLLSKSLQEISSCILDKAQKREI